MRIEARVILTSPVEYGGKDGNLHHASFITLVAPSSAAFRVASRIKQQMMRAIMAEQRKRAADPLRAAAPAEPEPQPGQEKAPAKEPERATGADMIQMLAQSDADLGELGDLVRELILSHGIALLDGEVRLTPILLDRLSLADYESVVGEYLATFPLA